MFFLPCVPAFSVPVRCTFCAILLYRYPITRVSAFLSRDVCFSIQRCLLSTRGVCFSIQRCLLVFLHDWLLHCLQVCFLAYLYGSWLLVCFWMSLLVSPLCCWWHACLNRWGVCISPGMVSCPYHQRCFLPVSSGGFIPLDTEACSLEFVLSATQFGRLVVCLCLFWLHVWPVEKC